MKAVAELNWLELFLAHSMKLLRSNLLPLLPKLMPKRSMPPLLLLITLVRPLQLKCLSFIQINSWIQNAAPLQSVGVKGDRVVWNSLHFSANNYSAASVISNVNTLRSQ
jgi:hypothetical protein